MISAVLLKNVFLQTFQWLKTDSANCFACLMFGWRQILETKILPTKYQRPAFDQKTSDQSCD